MKTIQTLVDAGALGSVYALMAVGIGLVFGVLRLVNFAYGQLVMAGAYAEPADGAALVWHAADTGPIERFVASDPYVKNGIVTRWRIRPWTVVIGA